MNFIKKNMAAGLFACLMLLSCVILCACGFTGIPVELYDGDNFVKEVTPVAGMKYDFGVPEKTGYSFLGWYTEKEGGSALTDASGSSAGMKWKEETPTKLYAHWKVNEYTITFDYCGADSGNEIAEISVVYDTVINGKLPVPKKQGLSFMGWYTAAENGTQITDASGNFLNGAQEYTDEVYPVSEQGTTLYAHWGKKNVTFIFSTDGSSVEKVTYPVGTVLYSLPSSLKDNYCFKAWCFDQTLNSEMTFPYTIDESSDDVVTLYAKFLYGSVDVLQFNTIASSMDKEYEVTYIGNAAKIVIPDYYYGKKVTKIKKISSSALEEIVLPQTIKTLETGAFENCTSLKSVNIPSGVTVIAAKTFAGCTSLANVCLPQGLTEIGKEAFSGCSSITQINISANVKTIGAGAFRNTVLLEKITVDSANERYTAVNGVLYYKVGSSYYLVQYPAAKSDETYSIEAPTVKILEYAFSNAKISSIVIGGKVSYIENGAFENCKNLSSVTISGNAISFTIDENAFFGCSNLKALKIELDKVPALNATAFDGVADTFSVYVMSGMIRNYQTAANWRNISDKIHSLGMIYGDFAVEEINGGYTVVQYFGAEKEVVIPEILNANKIVAISENAFAFSKMEKVTVSKYVTEIGDGAFKNCAELREIILECEPPVLGENAFEGISEDYGIYIKNSASVLDAYRKAAGWKEISENIWSYQ